jgi:hypothetical protein
MARGRQQAIDERDRKSGKPKGRPVQDDGTPAPETPMEAGRRKAREAGMRTRVHGRRQVWG